VGHGGDVIPERGAQRSEINIVIVISCIKCPLWRQCL
jgi:hypothetical protein